MTADDSDAGARWGGGSLRLTEAEAQRHLERAHRVGLVDDPTTPLPACGVCGSHRWRLAHHTTGPMMRVGVFRSPCGALAAILAPVTDPPTAAGGHVREWVGGWEDAESVGW